jgi:hypothetical protein
MAKGPLSRIAAKIKKRGTKGVFARAAHAHGMSTRQYAEEHKHDKGLLALTFMKHRG